MHCQISRSPESQQSSPRFSARQPLWRLRCRIFHRAHWQRGRKRPAASHMYRFPRQRKAQDCWAFSPPDFQKGSVAYERGYLPRSCYTRQSGLCQSPHGSPARQWFSQPGQHSAKTLNPEIGLRGCPLDNPIGSRAVPYAQKSDNRQPAVASGLSDTPHPLGNANGIHPAKPDCL